jgi:hypothetical protein
MLDFPVDLSPVQLIGYCGALSGMVWPLFRGRTTILLAQLVPSFCFMVHFWLLGGLTAATLNLLAILQGLAAIPLGTRPNFRIVYVMILPVIAGLMLMTWTGWLSLFAALAMMLVSVARYQTGVTRFRLFMALALPCWFTHSLLIGSVPGMLSDAVGMTVNLWMLVRNGAFEAFWPKARRLSNPDSGSSGP